MQKQNKIFFLLFILLNSTNFYCNKSSIFLPKHGDLVFQDLDSSPLCDAIEQVTDGFDNKNFSHIGIVMVMNKTHYVLEAFSNGVDTIPLKKFLSRNLDEKRNPKVIVGRLKQEYQQLIPVAIEYGKNLIGKDYDEEFKINNNKFYCSELIYEIFYRANDKKNFFFLQPMTYKKNGETLIIWEEYFEKLKIPIPEKELGINPGGISLSKKINIIHDYQQ